MNYRGTGSACAARLIPTCSLLRRPTTRYYRGTGSACAARLIPTCSTTRNTRRQPTLSFKKNCSQVFLPTSQNISRHGRAAPSNRFPEPKRNRVTGFHRDIIRIDHFGDGQFSLPRPSDRATNSCNYIKLPSPGPSQPGYRPWGPLRVGLWAPVSAACPQSACPTLDSLRALCLVHKGLHGLCATVYD